MFVIHFGFRKPEIKRGYLYGERSNPKIFIIRLGFISIIKMGSEATRVIHNAIHGLSKDSDWLCDNHPEIKRRIKQQVSEQTKEKIEQEKYWTERAREELSDVHQKLMQRNGEVDALKKTLKILEE